VRQITQGLFLREQREAANAGILLTPMKRSDDRPGRKQRRMTMKTEITNAMTRMTNDDTATHELSIEELDAVAGGAISVKGFVGAMVGGAVGGALVGAVAGGVGAAPGAAAGASACGIAYIVSGVIDYF
jgi:hypothetical protein